jgi:hypothetical protein
MILDVNDVLDHVDSKAVTPTDATLPIAWKKGEAKAKSILLDGVKDHIIPHLTGKTPAKDMWTALNDLYQSKNENRVMVLRERLRSTKMVKGEGVVHYLTRLTQIKDELGTVGEKTEESELVHVALNNFSKSWDVFMRGVVAREKLLDWQQLWDNFVQEEIGLGQSESSSPPHNVNEEGLALASKGKEKKEKGGKKNIDFSKVKCFQCHKMGHFASQCPEKKKKNQPQMAASAAVDEFAKIFEEDFFFIARMSSAAVSNMWFVDSGASCHMTRRRSFSLGYRREA